MRSCVQREAEIFKKKSDQHFFTQSDRYLFVFHSTQLSRPFKNSIELHISHSRGFQRLIVLDSKSYPTPHITPYTVLIMCIMQIVLLQIIFPTDSSTLPLSKSNYQTSIKKHQIIRNIKNGPRNVGFPCRSFSSPIFMRGKGRKSVDTVCPSLCLVYCPYQHLYSLFRAIHTHYLLIQEKN